MPMTLAELTRVHRPKTAGGAHRHELELAGGPTLEVLSLEFCFEDSKSDKHRCEISCLCRDHELIQELAEHCRHHSCIEGALISSDSHDRVLTRRRLWVQNVHRRHDAQVFKPLTIEEIDCTWRFPRSMRKEPQQLELSCVLAA